MVVNRSDIKRKRKDDSCFSMLDESPKRTKVHAQRKFAQGSNVSSPVITPVKEIERQERNKDVLPEPIELLPMKRPNTEAFLTFLCFRGTPILPPNLNFFNTASMVDSPLKTHEPKTTYPKNGPILTTAPSKCQNEKPFVAFGVRKRADPVVISKQMDRKRRHALALQALRRKYQEQKMAKIRAVTISKLSEKVTNKNIVRTRSVTKNEIASKKSVMHKTDIKVISTKHITTKTAIKQPIKSRMCLRSFRGRYIHRELNIKSHRKRTRVPVAAIRPPPIKKKIVQKEKSSSEFSSDDDEPLMKSVKPKSSKKTSSSTLKKQKKTVESNIRLTRSHNKLPQTVQSQQRKQTIKHRRIITRLSSMMMTSSNQRVRNKIVQTTSSNVIRNLRRSVSNMKRNSKQNVTQVRVRSSRRCSTIRSTIEEKTVSTTKTRSSTRMVDKATMKQQKENVYKKEESPKNSKEQVKVDLNATSKKSTGVNEKENDVKPVKKIIEKTKIEPSKPKTTKSIPHQIDANNTSTNKKNDKLEKSSPSPKTSNDEKPKVTVEKQTNNVKAKETERQSSEPSTRRKVDTLKKANDKTSSNNSRPSRKTKEAAAIYMELLGHKLVNDKEVDDDDESIVSFPELPNARLTEQRENELKAKAKSKIADKKDISASTTAKSSNSKEEKEGVKKIKAMEVVQPTSSNSSKSKTQNGSELKKNDKISASTSKEETCGKKQSFQEEQKNQKTKAAEEKNIPKKSNSTSSAQILTVKQEECFSEKRKDEFKIYKEVNPNNTSPKTPVKTLRRHTSVTESDIDKAMALMLQSSNLTAGYDASESPDSLKKNEKNDLENSATNTKNEKPPVDETNTAVQDQNFSDSDEEPLSNLTKSKEKVIVQSENQEIDVIETKKVERSKRDCVKKKAHNYLPFSSSDDEEKYFHGFVETELKMVKNETMEKCPQHSLPSSDLSCKDVSRRYGKGKVNMSNEQIEKWLNDSAMAGMNIKKEEDDLLKYEDERRISPSLVEQSIETLTSATAKLNPVESSASSPSNIIKIEDKNFNKTITLATNKEIEECLSINSSTPEKSVGDSTNAGPALVTPPKNLPAERKTIFKKKRSVPVRNVNAFSANNECSVYAFEADNEDSTSVSTPFRRPCRRPSSTATSRSEDDSKLMDDASKHSAGAVATVASSTTGKFRFPTALRGDFKLNNKQDSAQSIHDYINNSSPATILQTNLDVHTFTDTSNSEPPSVTEEADHQSFYTSSNKHVSPDGNGKINTGKPTTTTGSLPKGVPSRAKPTARAGAAQSQQKFVNHDKNMCPPSTSQKGGRNDPTNKQFTQKSVALDIFEDAKYKIPSSPSASSSSSAKLASRRQAGKNHRNRLMEMCAPINVSDFPHSQQQAQIVEAPTFHPSEKEFQDPLDYIEKIRSKAEKFGICRIIPPANFKPECKVSDDMRFTAYNQYVHKMLHRWGPNFKELMAIRKYLETQKITLTHPPWIGGMEIDLPRLYQTVQSLGGLKEVIEKKKWSKVSESMKIPKSAQDRVTKLDDIYCKYLLPYDTLSPAEREKLFDEVETEWAKRESKTLLKVQRVNKMDTSSGTDADSDSDNESEECIVKGRNVALNAFYRIARNTMSMWFKTIEPAAEEVEQEFWKHVTLKNNHICVHSGSIDSGNWGYGFPVSKNSPFARHAWNLKVLTNNSGSVLRSMGPVMGVTVPTLHVGMVFSACCWYRDPHRLPWIEYLHTGAHKIWYGIPDSMSERFHSSMLKLVPNYCRNKSIWLPSDTVMVPPKLLVENGVSLCRTVQEPGQFVVVFPKVNNQESNLY